MALEDDNSEPQLEITTNGADHTQALAHSPSAPGEIPEKILIPGAADEKPANRPASNVGRSVWRIFVSLLKLVLLLAILGALGLGLYFGLPILYTRYILPIQNNTEKVALLETRQKQDEDQIAGLREELAAAATKQARLESSLTGLGARLETLGTRAQTLENEINAHTSSLAALAEIQTRLQADGSEMNSRLDSQVKLLKSMELLSRARLFLYQSNFGLAKQDVQTARGLLDGIHDSASIPAADLAEVLTRLDATLARLPDFPVAASDDLDIAWQILLQGIPQQTPTPDLSQTPTATPFYTTTPTASLDSTVTATPPVTPAPTATP